MSLTGICAGRLVYFGGQCALLLFSGSSSGSRP